MRKKIATLLLAFAFILPCSLFFTACGKEDDVKVNGISVELISNDYTLTDKTITVSYGDKLELDAQDFKVTATLSNGKTKVISEKTENSDGYTFESTLPSDNKTPVGNYTLTFSHAQVEENLEITINVVKARVDMSGVSWNFTSPFTFDGDEKTIELTGLPEGVSVAYQGNSATDANTYTAIATFSYVDTNNYESIPSMTKSWQILPAKYVPNVSATLKSNFEGIKYTGTNQSVELDIVNNDANNVRAEVVPETLTAKDAGKYYARVNLEYIGGSNNYDGVATEFLTVEWEIGKEQLTVTAKNNSIIYGDAPANAGVEYTGFVTGEDESVLSGTLDFDYTYSIGNNAEKDYTITPKGLTSNNYEINFVSGKLNVAKKNLTLKVNPVTINYNTDATNNGIQAPTDFISTDKLEDLGTLVFNYGGYEKGDNVGKYDITVDINWFDKDNVNYNVICEKATLEVVKIDVDIDEDDVSLTQTVFTYTGEDITSLLDVAINAEGVTKNYITVETKSPVDVDTYTAVIYLKYFDTVNYNAIPEIKKEFRIEKATVGSFDSVALAKNSMPYTGKLQEVEFVNVPTGAKVGSIIGNTATNANKVGEKYTVEVSFVCAVTKNYVDFGTVTKTFDWNITPVKLVIKAKDHEIFYNEQESNNGVTYTGLVNNEKFDEVLSGTLNFRYTYSVGNPVSTEGYDIEPFGLTSTNYDIDFEKGKLFVKHAKIDFANINWVVASPYTYNGNAITPVLNYKLDNVNYTYTYSRFVGGENPSYIPVEGNKPINVGTYLVHVDIELTNSNYVIINNQIEDYKYVIVPQKVNVSTLTWNMSNEVTFTGEEIQPTISNMLNTLNIVEYVYTKGGEVVDSVINVGTYTATVVLETINNNYEIEGTCADLTYTIIPKPVDCSSLAWVETTEFTYNSNSFEPKLQQIPAGIKATYSYTTKDGQSVEHPTNVGEYIAYVEVEAKNNNYTLTNYTNLEPLNFEILKAEIDITNLNWNTDLEEFEYNKNEIKPVLNVENVDGLLTFTYKYTHWTDENGEWEEVEVSPINVGHYTVRAMFNYDDENCVLIDDGEQVIYDTLIKEYSITHATATIGEVAWNLETTQESKGEDYVNYSLTMEYPGSAISFNIVCDDLTMFNVRYSVDYCDVDNITISGEGYYYISAYITLKDEYSENYNNFNYFVSLNLNVFENPFETLTINDETISYSEFRNKETFEYLDCIAFTLKEGYYACDRDNNTLTSPIYIDNYDLSFIVRKVPEVEGELGQEVLYKWNLSYYYMDEISIDNNNYSLKEGNSILLNLRKEQTSFGIDFDDRYLTKYGSQLTYSIEYSNKNPICGNVTSLPLVIDDAKNVTYVYINLQDGIDSYRTITSIDVEQYSLVKAISYKKVSLYDDMENLVTIEKGYFTVNLDNELLVDFSATVDDGYTVNYFMDYELTQQADFTNLTNLDNIYIAVYNGEEVVEIKSVNVYFNLSINGLNITHSYSYNVSNNEFGLGFESGNPNITISSLVDGKETITLTEDFTTINYSFTAVYNSKIYTYTKEIKVIKSRYISEFFEYGETPSEHYLTYSIEPSKSYRISEYSNSVDMQQDFSASNIKSLDLSKVSLTLAQGYSIASKELVADGGSVYLKLIISYESQGEEPQTASTEEYVVLLLLNITGRYDSDTSGVISIYYLFESNEIPVDVDADEINIDIGTQALDITLNNMHAIAYITNEDGTEVLMQTTDGYIDGVYTFKATGTYKLKIYATDGTSKTYTINVTGEVVPILTIVAGGKTLTQTMGANGPTEGSFMWQKLDEYGIESSFTALLGKDVQLLINNGKFTVTSVNSPMLATATMYTNDGTKIDDATKSFELTVLGDASAPYVMFYAETTEGSKSYIYLYLCDNLPATKALEIVYNGKTYTQYMNQSNGSTYGDFETFEYESDMIFIGYVGAQATPTDTITLTSLYFIYPSTIKDMMTNQTVSTDNLTLSVETDPDSGISCAGLVLEFEPAEKIEISMCVIFYLTAKPDEVPGDGSDSEKEDPTDTPTDTPVDNPTQEPTTDPEGDGSDGTTEEESIVVISFTCDGEEYVLYETGEGEIISNNNPENLIYYVYLGEEYLDTKELTITNFISEYTSASDAFDDMNCKFTQDGKIDSITLIVGDLDGKFDGSSGACVILNDNFKLYLICNVEF